MGWYTYQLVQDFFHQQYNPLYSLTKQVFFFSNSANGYVMVGLGPWLRNWSQRHVNWIYPPTQEEWKVKVQWVNEKEVKVALVIGIKSTSHDIHTIHGAGVFTYMNGWFLW